MSWCVGIEEHAAPVTILYGTGSFLLPPFPDLSKSLCTQWKINLRDWFVSQPFIFWLHKSAALKMFHCVFSQNTKWQKQLLTPLESFFIESQMSFSPSSSCQFRTASDTSQWDLTQRNRPNLSHYTQKRFFLCQQIFARKDLLSLEICKRGIH